MSEPITGEQLKQVVDDCHAAGLPGQLTTTIIQKVQAGELKPAEAAKFGETLKGSVGPALDPAAIGRQVSARLEDPAFAGFRAEPPTPTSPLPPPAWQGNYGAMGMQAGQGYRVSAEPPLPGSVETLAAQLREKQAAVGRVFADQARREAEMDAVSNAAAHDHDYANRGIRTHHPELVSKTMPRPETWLPASPAISPMKGFGGFERGVTGRTSQNPPRSGPPRTV